MAGRGQHKTLPMEGKDMARFLASTVGSFIQDRLINRDQRAHHKDQCADRLAAAGPAGEEEGSVRYSDQAVLANLDWGIEALEEAIDTSNTEAKLARLDHAEKMLQVAAMLDPTLSTAGVPNSYLSAWAHLNLAFLWALRRGNGNGNGNANSPVLHVLEMFAVDPFFSRIDFAPELWKALFLPHMGSIVGWYSESRHRVIVEPAPDSADLSFIADDKFFDDDSSMLLSLRPDQGARLRQMEQIYGESLDDNTRLYAKYYKDCVKHDPAAAGGKMGMPMMPIAEPPMTPRHEVSRSIPDFVKFGPILPKSSGFNPALNPVFLRDVKNRSASKRRVGVTSTSGEGHGESTNRLFEEPLLEDNEEEIDSDGGDVYIDSETRTCQFIALNNMMPKEDTNSSPKVFSPVDSPKTPSPRNISFPKPVTELELLSLLSGHSTSLRESQHLFNDLSVGSCDFDGEMKLQKSHKNSSGSRENTNTRSTMNRASENNSFHAESEEEVSPSNISLPSSERSNLQTKPPKDFVCPITGQLFVDPVTLETGQTYERRAIHEWIKRGNTTCPITRQPLSATVLPKTNYVLKRLINSWKEQLHDISRDFSFSETPSASLSPISSIGFPSESTNSQAIETELPQTVSSSFNGEIRSKRFMRARVFTSPTSVISQAAVETVINGLEPYTSCLCTSEELQACEAAVLAIARIWKDSKVDPAVLRYLSKPAITNGFVELLSASMNREVLRTSIYILSELISADESIAETLTSVDSDFDCLANLLKNGLAEAATLIYQLRPAFSHLSNHDLIPSLVQVIMSKGIESNDFRYVMEPKDSAIALLEQILLAGDENSRSLNALNVISENGLPALVKCLDQNDGRLAVVSILLSCMRADRSCTNLIANRADLAPVLELFHAGNDSTRSICIDFLSELVRLNRRTVCNQILQIIKDEGAFSTMHTFLVYLQMAPMEQQSVVACLLLQLDLLVEPRKMSIYREEAIETLIEALNNKDFPICQTIALDALSSLSGRLSASGKPLLEAWLLNSAGLDQPFNNLVKEERMGIWEDVSLETMEEEEKATSAWEKRVAFVLCNHDNGSIFKALEECLRSNSLELAKSCLVIATWLTHMLSILPDTGIRVIARHSFLDLFINVLQSSRSLEERVLASLALKSFVSDKDALEGLGMYAKSIWKPLRNLRRCSVVAADTLKALTSLPHVDTTELWSCTEIADIDTGANGEVLSLVHLKGHVFSSHSDGMIKVWDAGKRGLRLIQELRDHTKAVTCLFVPSSGDKLYSGSLDRTIRVWAIEPEEIHCVQVHDVKEPVHWLACSNTVACFTSQGTGIKIYNWGGVPKHVNFSKNVKCLAIAEGHLYCGCSCSIQEVDLSRCTTSTLFSGPRKLLGKQSILALCVHDNLLFAGGSSVEGTAGKVFSLSAKATIGSFLTGHDIHSIAVNGDFVFTGTKSGIIEVWLRERLARIASIKVGGGANSKVMSLASDSNGEMLFAGSSDGRIQVWSLD